MIPNSAACYKEMVRERKSQSMQQTSLSYFVTLPPLPSAITILITQQPSTLKHDPPPAKRLQLTEGSHDGWHFLVIKYF